MRDLEMGERKKEKEREKDAVSRVLLRLIIDPRAMEESISLFGRGHPAAPAKPHSLSDSTSPLGRKPESLLEVNSAGWGHVHSVCCLLFL